MCYRCQICNEVVPHGTARSLFIIEREVPRKTQGLYETYHFPRDHNGKQVARSIMQQFPLRMGPTTRREIAREIPVCAECKLKLEGKRVVDKPIRRLPSNTWDKSL